MPRIAGRLAEPTQIEAQETEVSTIEPKGRRVVGRVTEVQEAPRTDDIGTMSQLASRVAEISGQKQATLRGIQGGPGMFIPPVSLPTRESMAKPLAETAEGLQEAGEIVKEADLSSLTPATGAALALKAGGPIIESRLPLLRAIPDKPKEALIRAGLGGLGATIGSEAQVIGEQITGAEGAPSTPQEVSERLTSDIQAAFAAELGGETLAGAIRPTGQALSQATKRAIEIAKEQKLPIAPSSLVPGKVTEAIEFLGEATLGGNIVGTARRKQLVSGLQSMADEIKLKAPTSVEKVSSGQKLTDAVYSKKAILREETEGLYKKFGDALVEQFGDTPISSENLKSAIDDGLGQLSVGSEGYNLLRNMSDKIASQGGLTAEELLTFQSQIWKKIPTNKRIVGGKVWEGIKADLDSETPYIKSMIDNAQEAFKLEKSFAKNKAVKSILDVGERNPELVVTRAVRTNNFEDMAELKKVLTTDEWDILRSQFVQNIIDTSTSTQGANRVFEPLKFLKTYEKYKPQIENLMPEVAKNVDDFALVVDSSIDDIKKATGFSASDALKLTGRLGVSGTGGVFSGPFMVVPEGFSAVLTNSILKPTGLMKKLLTTGSTAIREKAAQAAVPAARTVAGATMGQDGETETQRPSLSGFIGR